MFNVAGDAVVKCQGQFQTAAEAITVDGDHFWKRQGFDAVKQAVNLVNAVAGHFGIFIAVEFPHVGTDDKRALLGRLQHKPGGCFFLKRIDDGSEFTEDFHRQTVGAFTFAINTEP